MHRLASVDVRFDLQNARVVAQQTPRGVEVPVRGDDFVRRQTGDRKSVV
jgi:hypothetical protein